MVTAANERSITLTPSRKAFFWGYFFGILLTPLLIGLFILWRTIRTQNATSYIITDRQITVVRDHISQNIDLADIRNAEPVKGKMGSGTVILRTGGRNIELIGLEHPERIAASIEKAAEAERKRLETQKRTRPRPAQYEPGTMDRLDQLTGLWQQGLLSDEDFRKEKENL